LQIKITNTAHNSVLSKLAVQFSADTLTNNVFVFHGIDEPFGGVAKQTLVLRINIHGKDLQLLLAAIQYRKCYRKKSF